MAWEQLNAVILSGNTYNLPKLTSTAFTWACNNYNILTGTKKKDFTSDVRDGSQGDAPFRLTSYSQITTYNNQTFSFANNNDNFLFWAYTGSQVTPVMTGTIGSNSTNVQVDNFPNNGDAYPICYGFAIDRDNEIAFMWAASKNGYDSMYGVYIMSVGTTETRHLLYNDLMANQPVLYQWSSVPAISGKNGILSLTQILNINDGEPVEDVTNKGNLDFSKKTKVNTLINSAYEPTYSEDETKATISYDIPESDYQYTKLVYKKKKIPKSASDGDVIDLNVDATEIVVNNLDEDSKYYFKIFTDKTQSNSYKYSTGSNPLPEGKWLETVSTCKATDDSFSMSFNESTEQWKVNQSGATDEWVWLRNLGDYTLTTSSKTPAEVFANANILTYDTLNAGSNLIRVLQQDYSYFEKQWNLDSSNYFRGSQYTTYGYGWNLKFSGQFGSGGSWIGGNVPVYGIDVLIAVNHYTMQARTIWVVYKNNSGSSLDKSVESSANANEYFSLSKFMN